jgi:hypothetical protein
MLQLMSVFAAQQGGESEIMSSVVVQSCTQGFVISTDSIANKEPIGEGNKKLGRIKGTTRKLFQLSDDVIAAGVGEWTSYMPVLNAAARSRLPTAKLVSELLDGSVKKATDSRIFVLYRIDGRVFLDAAELGHVRREQGGAAAYPSAALNGLFQRVYESPEGLAIRKTGILGIASVIGAFNAMAASLSAELSPPFDTVMFLNEGLVIVTGGITKLPITEYW